MVAGAVPLLCLSALVVSAQNRDFNAERIIIDDNASDGGRNTLTLRVPPAGLSANRTLTFPDADGAILTAAAPLTVNQILFGSPTGTAAQSPNFLWDGGTNTLNIGSGNFTVEGATGNTTVGGTLDLGFTAGSVVFAGAGGVLDQNNTAFFWDEANERLGVGTNTPGTTKIHAFTTAAGMSAIRADNLNVDPNGQGVFSYAEGGTGVLGMTATGIGVWGYSAGAGLGLLGSSENGPAAQFLMNNVANNNTVVEIANAGGGTSLVIDSGSSGIAMDVRGSIVNGLDNVVVDDNLDVTGVLDAQAAGNVMGDGTNAEQLQIDGVNGGAVEVDINGDVDISGTLTTGGFASGPGGFILNGDLDVNGNNIIDGGDGDVTIIDDLRMTGNVIPSADNTYTLGTDAFRWAQVFVNGGSVHIGDAGGVGTDEVVIGYDGATTGTIGVNGTTVVDFTTTDVGVTGNLNVDGNTTVNSAAGTDLSISETGFDRNSGAAETLALDNSGAGDVNVLINGATSTTNSRLTIDDGHWTSQQTTAPAGAVAGANVTSVTLANETDVAGHVDILSSGTPAAGAQATVTFNTTYATAPIVVLTAANGAGAGIGAYVTRTTAGFTINFIGVPAGGTNYQFFYQVIETQ